MNESGEVLRQVGAIFSGGSVAGMTDAELLDRFINRQDESGAIAFEAIVGRHGPMVMRICRASLRNAHDAEDAFQATFLVLARKAGSLWVRDSLAGWLANVASKTANRSRSRIARHAGVPLNAEPIGTDSDHELSDTRRTLFEEVQRLPDRTRVPILLCYFEGLTHEAAASTLRLPVGTIHSRLARGRERLKSRLIRRGLAPSGALIALGSPLEAAISPALRQSTIKAALTFATSGALASGSVPASVVALVQGVLGTMFLTKLQIAGAVVLSASFLTAGAVVVAQGSGQGNAKDEAPAQKTVPAEAGATTGSTKIDSTEAAPPETPSGRPAATVGSPPSAVDLESMRGPSNAISSRELLVKYRIAKLSVDNVAALHRAAVVSREELTRAEGDLELIEAQAEAQRDDLKDLIELLQAQKETKAQEVEVERAISKGKHVELERITGLKNQKVVSSSEVASITAETERSDAEIKARQAAASELDVRISQASRRLTAIEKVLETIQKSKKAHHPEATNPPTPRPAATDAATGIPPASSKP